jgi:hypothetical protein
MQQKLLNTNPISTRNGHVFIAPNRASDVIAQCDWCGEIVDRDDETPCQNNRRVVAINRSEDLAKYIGKPKAVKVVLRREIVDGETIVVVIAHTLESTRPKRRFS